MGDFVGKRAKKSAVFGEENGGIYIYSIFHKVIQI